MKNVIIYIFIFSMVFSSCKKQEELPLPVITNPHFFVKCEIDGQFLDIEAGDQAYYMNSSWFYHDSEGVYVYKANLAKQLEDGYQVTILINDAKPGMANGAMNPDSTLKPRKLLYNDQNKNGYTQVIKFEPVNAYINSSNYSWSVNNGTLITNYGIPAVDDKYSFSEVFSVGKTYSVTFNYGDGLGVCSADPLTNVFKAGSMLQTTVNAVRDTSSADLRYILSYTLLEENPNIECLWTFPDATTDASPSLNRFFKQGKHKINLKLTDKVTRESCVSNYQLNADYSDSRCNANYKAIFSPVHNDRLHSSVTILVTTPDGVVYSSKNLVQPEDSYFEISSVENYKANEKNEATKSIEVKFNCVLKSGNREIILRNGAARVAVAYK